MPQTTVAASVDVDVVRRRFNWDWATDPDSAPEMDTYWWWARSIRVDPMEVIADDDDGNLYRVPFQTDGEDEVTFGEPERVRETFVPVSASVGRQVQQVTERTGQRVLAAALDRPTKSDPATAASSAADPEQEEVTMPDIDMDALRSRLGLSAEELPDDASAEQINEAIAAEPEGSNDNGEPETEPEGTPEGEPEPEPIAASALPDGMVAVPAEKWAEVQDGAKAGTELKSETEIAKRDKTIEAALKVGKVPPADKDSLVNMHAANPEGFYRLLTAEVADGGLAEGLVPVTEEGVAGVGDDESHAQIMAGAFGISRKED